MVAFGVIPSQLGAMLLFKQCANSLGWVFFFFLSSLRSNDDLAQGVRTLGGGV
jgi:hypothetical protein